MYDEIMHQLGRQDQVLELSIRSFWNEILERIAGIAGWHQMDEEMKKGASIDCWEAQSPICCKNIKIFIG